MGLLPLLPIFLLPGLRPKAQLFIASHESICSARGYFSFYTNRWPGTDGAAHWEDFPSLMVFRAAAKCICGARAVHFQFVPIHQVNTSTECGFFLPHQLSLKDPHTHHGCTGGSQAVVVDDVGIQAAYWCPLVLPCLIPDAPLLSYTSLNTRWLCMNSVHPEQC